MCVNIFQFRCPSTDCVQNHGRQMDPRTLNKDIGNVYKHTRFLNLVLISPSAKTTFEIVIQETILEVGIISGFLSM